MREIRDAKLELFNVFAENLSGKPKPFLNKIGVKKVYNGEPFGNQLVGPASITVHTGGMSQDTINLELRIYVDTSSNAQYAADLLDEIIETIEFGNVISGQKFSYIPHAFSVSEWETTFEESMGCWAALARLARRRNDF
jgi:hypothetical protein